MTWTVENDMLCFWCNRFFTIRSAALKKWFSSIKFCPFCGHALAISTEEALANGYEESK